MNVQGVLYRIVRAEERGDWSLGWEGETPEIALQEQKESVWLKQVFGDLSITMQHKIISSMHREGEDVSELMVYYAMTTIGPNVIVPAIIFSMVVVVLYNLFG